MGEAEAKKDLWGGGRAKAANLTSVVLTELQSVVLHEEGKRQPEPHGEPGFIT